MSNILRTNTATKICIGPFLDKTDGITPEIALTVASMKTTAVAETDNNNLPTLILDDVAGSDATNTIAHITNDNAGYYSLILTAANLNRLGRFKITVHYTAEALPVFHEFMIVSQHKYDSSYGADLDTVDVTKWNGTAVATPDTAGYPKVTAKSGTGTGELNLSSGVVDSNTTKWSGNAVAAPDQNGVPKVNVQYISGDDVDGNNATLKLKQLDVTNSAGTAIIAKSSGSNGIGIDIAGNGSGSAIKALGGATGHGLEATGQGGGNGILAMGGNSATTAGLKCVGGAALANGIYSVGNTAGDGIHAEGGSTGEGIHGNSTAASGMKLTTASGDGFSITGGTNGSGINATGAGTGCGILATGGNGGSVSGHGSGFNAVSGTSSYGAGISAINNGTGDGIYCLGKTSGNGLTCIGAGSGYGLQALSGTSGGAGIIGKSQAATNGNGIEGFSTGSGSGLELSGGNTGRGIHAAGGATSGDGIKAESTSGHGLNLHSGSGAVDNGINSISHGADGSGIYAESSGTGAGIFGGCSSSGNGIYGLSSTGNGIKAWGMSNGSGIWAEGSGAGSGIFSQANQTNGTGDGIRALAGKTSGNGIKALANSAAGCGIYSEAAASGIGIFGGCSGSGNGIEARSSAGNGLCAIGMTNGNGILAEGKGTGSGIKTTGGTTGNGILTTGGSSSGNGIKTVSSFDGHGIYAAGGSNEGDGIRAVGAAVVGNGINAIAQGGATGGNSDGNGIKTLGVNAGHGIRTTGGGAAGPGGDGIYASAGTDNANGLTLIGKGTGSGLKTTGGATGHGVYTLSGTGATGNGIRIISQSTTDDGLYIFGANHGGNIKGEASGLNITGNDDGIRTQSEGEIGEGHGIHAIGGGVSGSGIFAIAGDDGHGMSLNKGAAIGNKDLDADEIANMPSNVWAYGTRTLTAATNITSGIATAVWDELLSVTRVASSFGAKIKAWVLGVDNKALISTDGQDLSTTLRVQTKVITAGAINAAAIADNAIDAASFAADIKTGSYLNAQIKGQDNIDFGALQKTSLNAATPASIQGNVGGNVTGSVGSLATQAKADVNAEVDTALSDINLNRLLKNSAVSTDVADDSVFAQIMSKTADYDTYNKTTDSLEALGEGGSTGITAQEVRDAMKLAPTVGVPEAGSVDDHLDDIDAKTTNLPSDPASETNVSAVGSAVLNVDSDLAAVASDVTDIETKVDNIILELTDGVYGLSAIRTLLGTVDGKVDIIDTGVDAIVSKLPAVGPISNLSLTTNIDGKTLEYVLELTMAIANGRFKINTPAAGQTTLYKRDSLTPLTILNTTLTERTRIS